jgi:2-haloalkanoic acid dehalogenase type II
MSLPPQPKFVQFDCYGTLIQWNEGLARTFAGMLLDKNSPADPEFFRDTVKKVAHGQLRDSYRPYKAILSDSLRQALQASGLTYDESDAERLLAAIPTFPAYPEVRATLERIARACKLALISNTDQDLLPGSLEQFGVRFDLITTAERARAYKPTEAIFRFALERMGCAPGEVIHVAAGWWTDMEPATKLGLPKVWVNRRGEAGDAACRPYGEISTLSGLPKLLGIRG